MTEQPMYVFRFEMDIHDRMRKALRVADVSVQEIAEAVGINRNSVSAWLNGRSKPNDIQLKKFALRTGAPLEWLVKGEIKEHAPSPNGGGARGAEPTLR
ncbi:helix-turn-helix domain-containing protein [Paeniglutamicibacter sp. NPDC012692]|uniref:helix-turn-helix domain-containing protein n=1 Tax=Paeniglutamicibacter sp. NPDC012692 TaxID=3364388 RepID=UPI00367F80CF